MWFLAHIPWYDCNEWLASSITYFVSFSSDKKPKANSIAVYLLGFPIAPAQYFAQRIVDSGKLSELCEPLTKILEAVNPLRGQGTQFLQGLLHRIILGILISFVF